MIKMRYLGLFISFCCLQLFAESSSPNHFTSSSLREEFYRYIEKGMEEWSMPGLAIAVVKDNAVILSKGFGVKKAGEKKPVSPQTQFVLGSCSKMFTSCGICMLADKKELSLDQPIHQFLNGFVFSDPWVTQQLTAKDLLLQRTGLKTWQGNYLWKLGFEQAAILYRMRYLKPGYAFRDRFGYSNLSYLVLSALISAVTDMNWEDFIETQIFEPLGMNYSRVDFPSFDDAEDIAFPHLLTKEKLKPITFPLLENSVPIGGISSTAEDLSHFMRCLLNEGQFQSIRLLSPNMVQEMLRPSLPVPFSEKLFYELFPEQRTGDPLFYGLGWFVHDYQKRTIVEHVGNLPGISAIFSMMPEENVGVIILANRDEPLFLSAMKLKVYDYFLNLPSFDWLAAFKEEKMRREESKQEEEASALGVRKSETTPQLELFAYLGHYTHPLYGKVAVREEKQRLVLSLGQRPMKGFLSHWHYNTFHIHWDLPFLMQKAPFVTFSLDGQGAVNELHIDSMGDFQKIAK